MKKILCSLLILLSTIGCFAAAPEYFDWVYATNIVVWTPSQVLSNHIYPGAMDISRPAAPFISFYQSGIGGTPAVSETLYMEHVFRDAAFHGRFRASDDFRIDGNLTVVGAINSGSAVWTLTNIVYSTNVCYPTNEQLATVEMTLPYGLLEASTTLDFNAMSGTVNTQAQTAVVIVTNSSSPNVPFDITPTMDGLHTQGTLRVTNVTACSFFRYANKFTNMIALPLW